MQITVDFGSVWYKHTTRHWVYCVFGSHDLAACCLRPPHMRYQARCCSSVQQQQQLTENCEQNKHRHLPAHIITHNFIVIYVLLLLASRLFIFPVFLSRACRTHTKRALEFNLPFAISDSFQITHQTIMCRWSLRAPSDRTAFGWTRLRICGVRSRKTQVWSLTMHRFAPKRRCRLNSSTRGKLLRFYYLSSSTGDPAPSHTKWPTRKTMYFTWFLTSLE